MALDRSAVRTAQSYGVGALITLGLFWVMHLMIQGGKYAMEKKETLPTIDFVRLKKDSELETRTRQKPPKPPPPKEPPPPKMKVTPTAAPDPQRPTPMAMPSLNLSATMTGGPFLGTFTGGGDIGAGDGDLIPMVRIAPQYPRNALRDGIEGEVTLEITVGPDGTVKDARVKTAKPRGVFESAAVAAAFKGRFRPKVVDGKPQTTSGVYTVKFKLEAE